MSQLSVDKAPPKFVSHAAISAAVDIAPHSTIKSVGALVIIGLVTSIMEIVLELLDVLPQLSVAVNTTINSPSQAVGNAM